MSSCSARSLRQHFNAEDGLNLSGIYEEVFSREALQMENLKEDIRAKFEDSRLTFADTDSEDKEYLQLFAFISELSFDVYLKKHMIEMLIDELREENTPDSENQKSKKVMPGRHHFFCAILLLVFLPPHHSVHQILPPAFPQFLQKPYRSHHCRSLRNGSRG